MTGHVSPNVDGDLYTLSVVIPVYQGERTLGRVIDELVPLTAEAVTPDGVRYRVHEVILVHDNGPDHSDQVMHRLAKQYPFVRVIWLSKNFGQHAATIAGMAASTGRWIVTMDEDGQHDPAAIGPFLDAAVRERAAVVYARFTNARPHGFLRSLSSRSAKRILGAVSSAPDANQFQSFRLVRGDIGRKLAGFAVTGVYLDVALAWVTDRVAVVPTSLRTDDDRVSSYSYRGLFGYFWRMVLTSGTRGLRLVSLTGGILALLGLLMTAWVIYSFVQSGADTTEGWASLMVVILICSGATLVSLGVIAEYIGVSLNVAMGRPLYLVVDDPHTVMPDEDAPAAPSASGDQLSTDRTLESTESRYDRN